MGILDDVMVNAKAAAETVSQKASDLYDASKLKLSLTNLKMSLNKKYQEYGKAIYNQYDSKFIEKIKDEISEISDKIAAVTKLYESLKETVVCNSCGSNIPKNAQYCTICGAEQIEKKNTCPNCDYKVEDDSYYCANCGQKIK